MKLIKLLITLFSVFIIVYIVNSNKGDDALMNVKINIFNGITVFFIILLIFYTFLYGFNKGFYNTFIIWCIFVIATPIPEAGLLVSVPMKRILSINLEITQVIISILSMYFIVYSYYNFKSHLKTIEGGRFIIKIFELGEFSIFTASILASISLSYLLNELLTSLLIKEKKILTIVNILVFIFFIILFFYYFYVFKRMYSYVFT